MKGTITFVGFGLLASSLAAALKQGKHAVRIRAVSGTDTLQKAKSFGLADETFTYDQVESYLAGSDLVLLCGPISHILETMDAFAKVKLPQAKPILVSDIGSTKSQICQKGFSLPEAFRFVGGHPMAGSEKRSVEHHDASLFENAYWILCPPENIPPTSFAFLQELIDVVGAHSVTLAATEHDMVMARLSHVPQLVSTALAAGLSPRILARNQQHLAGRGFRDMTRIAASAWPMWRDILETNQVEVLAGIHEMQQSLASIESQVAALPITKQALQATFTKGNEVRASLSNAGKGFSHSLHEIFVHLDDQPGMILNVVQPLSIANINILDIELAKVREGVGGTLLLGFKTHESAMQALDILHTNGFEARLRA